MANNSSFSLYRQQYPDPFLDIASTKLPKDRKKLLELLFQFATTHPQIRPIVKKLSKYPITQVIVQSKKDGDHSNLEAKWKEVLEWDLNIYEIAESVGLDYMGYGNAFVTVHKPFVRAYRCAACKVETEAGSVKYFINNKKFVGQCPKCKRRVHFEGIDKTLSNASEISIVRIPPQEMYIKRNPLTNNNTYFRKVPKSLQKAVSQHKPDRELIDTTPWIYIQAALEKKKIKFAKNKVLHLKEPALSGYDDAWGLPIIMGALRDAYLLQVYKKADESVANERAVPARFIYPQASSQDPLRTISLSRFATFMNHSIRRYRQDKNAIMPVPFPVGVAEVGGDSQRLTTAPLREITVREIIGSTGVPEGFLGDGMTWSGGSVQLRMLENMIMAYMRSLNRLLEFVVREVVKVVNMPQVDVKFKPFRMTDDVQMLQILIQLYQMKIVSGKELLDRFDLDFNQQHDQILMESEKIQTLQVREALTEAKAALQSVTYQVDAQNKQESHQAMLDEMNQHQSSIFAHLSRQSSYGEAEQQQEEQEQQAAEAEQQSQELEQRYREAQAENLESEAAKDNAATAPLIDKLAKGIIADPDNAEETLNRIRTQAPGIAKQVEARIQELQGEGEQQQQQEVSPEQLSEDPSETLAALRAEAKNPQDLANGILMLPQDVRQPVFEVLAQEDPRMAVIVGKFIREQMGTGRGQHQNLKKADDRAMPEAKPPRRK